MAKIDVLPELERSGKGASMFQGMVQCGDSSTVNHVLTEHAGFRYGWLWLKNS